MKKHYDKILALIGLAVVCSSVAWYFSQEKSIASLEKSLLKEKSVAPKGKVWEIIDSPNPKLISVEWPLVQSQDDEGLWFYQLFTPPKIWVDTKNNFIAEPPFSKGGKKAFGVSFGDVKKEVYPIKLVGITTNREGLTTMQLKDDSTGHYGLFGTKGEEIKYRDLKLNKIVSSGLTIKSFEIKSEKDDRNITKERVFVTLYDANLGKNVTIERGIDTYLDDMLKINLVCDLPDIKNWTVQKVGDKIKSSDGAEFVVKEIDFFAPFVIVEKTSKVETTGGKTKTIVQTMKLSPGASSLIEK